MNDEDAVTDIVRCIQKARSILTIMGWNLIEVPEEDFNWLRDIDGCIDCILGKLQKDIEGIPGRLINMRTAKDKEKDDLEKEKIELEIESLRDKILELEDKLGQFEDYEYAKEREMRDDNGGGNE